MDELHLYGGELQPVDVFFVFYATKKIQKYDVKSQSVIVNRLI